MSDIDLIVIGGINVDSIGRADEPLSGDTGSDLVIPCRGKTANQAVAAARFAPARQLDASNRYEYAARELVGKLQ